MRCGALLERGEEALGVRREAAGWSVLQHLFHLLLAAELSLTNARNLASGRGALRLPRTELDPRAREVLVQGRLPRGTKAPRFVSPPARPDLALARTLQAEALAAARAPELAGELSGPLGIPHQVLGVLSAAEWLRFARLHSAHHLRIVAELRSRG